MSSEPPNIPKHTDVKFGFNDIWIFAITLVIGGQYYGWNVNYSNGFGCYAVAQVLMAFAFITYVGSIAEVTSTFPFSGGGFGLARTAQGFYVVRKSILTPTGIV